MEASLTDYDAWAWLYDRTLGPDYRDQKMTLLRRLLLDDLPTGVRVLDLCCGTGQMLAPMAQMGFETLGIDISEDMLRHAARNAPQAELRLGDARSFTLDKPVSGITCASASLNHMSSRDDLARVFQSAHRALHPGGKFVFDINHPAQMQRHWLGRPAAGEIRADYAWLITPRYDPATAKGAFRVDMYRPPDAGASSTGPSVLRAVLGRRLLRGVRLRRLARFAQHHPDWASHSVEYPVFGYDIDQVLADLTDAGFDATVQTPSGASHVDADAPACFVATKTLPKSEVPDA